MTREEKIKKLDHFCGIWPYCSPTDCPLFRATEDGHCKEVEYFTDAELDESLRAVGIDPATGEEIRDSPLYHLLRDDDEDPDEITADNVNHPQHYELPGGLECFDVMLATHGKEAMESYCLVNAFKYLFRCRRKNGNEDVEKARWYLNKWHELREGAEE